MHHPADLDPRANGYSSDENYVQKSTDFDQVENNISYREQSRIVGRRWAKNGGTLDAIQMSDGTGSRDYGTDQSKAKPQARDQNETDQSAAEDTLPRRGHMKTLLARWRQFEQRRREDQLIKRAATERSTRTTGAASRATTAWLRTSPDSENQQHRVPPASARSQSCGPVARY